MGRVASAYDSALMELFFGSMQIELVHRQSPPPKESLVIAIRNWIEAFYNPARRHSGLKHLSPTDYENRDAATPTAA